VKEGWVTKRLGEIIMLQYGKALSDQERVSNGKYPAFGANGIKTRTNKFLCQQPTIIIGRKGSAGELHLTSEPSWPLDVSYYMKYDSLKHDIKFLFYLLKFLDLPSLARGVKPGINRVQVYEKVVSFPLLLSEQQRIVAILDAAFADLAQVKANAGKIFANAKEVFASELNAIFEHYIGKWDYAKLSALTTKIGSGATPRGGKDVYKKIGIPLVRSLNVYDGCFHHEKLAFIDDSQAEKLNNVILYSNDVLLNITGASLARCCVLPEEYVGGRVNQHVSILRPAQDKLNSYFLCYTLFAGINKQKLLRIGDEAGATRQALTKSDIEIFEVPAPPLPEQHSIVARLDELSAHCKNLESIYAQKIALCDELKQSLLHKAFSGEL
jgi:type I restriction enzyme S subunit